MSTKSDGHNPIDYYGGSLYHLAIDVTIAIDYEKHLLKYASISDNYIINSNLDKLNRINTLIHNANMILNSTDKAFRIADIIQLLKEYKDSRFKTIDVAIKDTKTGKVKRKKFKYTR